MEENNNDPNNNDVVILNRMNEQDIDEDMGQMVGVSETSSSFTEEELEAPPDSPSSGDSGHSFVTGGVYLEEGQYLFYGSDSDISENKESNSSESDNITYGTALDQIESEDSIVEIKQENSIDDITEEPNILDQNIEFRNSTTEDTPSTSMPTLSDDYHAIKNIVPKLSDNMIFKYLHKNEDHDNRLLASMWDLMHAINKPKSKHARLNPSPVDRKKFKKKKSPEILPVPGKAGAFTKGNVKFTSDQLTQEKQSLKHLENRKDYKRVPKRAHLPENRTDVDVDKKKRKTSEPAILLAPSSSSTPQNSTSIFNKIHPFLSPPKLNSLDLTQKNQSQVPDIDIPKTNNIVTLQNTATSFNKYRENIAGSSNKSIKSKTSKPSLARLKNPESSSNFNLIRPKAIEELLDKDKFSNATTNNIHGKVSSKPLIATCVDANTHDQASFYENYNKFYLSNPILKPAILNLNTNKVEIMPVDNSKNVPGTSTDIYSGPLANPKLYSGPLANPRLAIANGAVGIISDFTSNNNPIVATLDNKITAVNTNDFTEQELNIDLTQEMQKLLRKDVFDQLTAMFEKVRREYILKLCRMYETIMDKQQLQNCLIDILLANGHKYEKNEVEEMQKVNLQDKYNDLLEIFPDACPEYLRTHASNYLNDPDKFKIFVQNNLEHKNYPTKEEYLKKKKIREQLEQYISNFNVVQFLDIFPSPFEYFENPNRRSNPDLSLSYLKTHYNKYRIDTIHKIFMKQNQNLSLTIKDLNNLKTDLKGRRYNKEPVNTHNIPFAQEVAFIRHRQEILEYLQSVEESEKNEYKHLKQIGALLECQCCFNDECISSKCSNCENGHIFCHSCIIRGTESTMADGETHVKCFTSCDGEFSLSVLQKVLKPTKFSILLTKRQEAEVKAAGLEGLVSCPFCHFASIPPKEDKIFKCLNQDCMKESCRTCKELNHVPLTCEEAKASDKARHILEEQMTKALIRICYKCKKPFFKEEGCNKMTCTCGGKMCYICGQPVQDYGHFRGQGSDALELCPLYTDDPLMNAEVVRRVAEKTVKNLMEKDPNVKLDTDKLLPQLPLPKAGPHNAIVNPRNYPEHALRARPYNNND